MKTDFNVAIVGAGMVGLVTAVLLAQSPCRDNLRITIIDAGKKPQFDVNNDVALRVSAISLGSINVFQDIGVWKSILGRRASAYQRMRVWDSRESVEGPDTLRFDAADFAVPELGFIVENILIQHVLLNRLDELGVEVRFNTPIAITTDNSAQQITEVQLQDGTSIAADLLIGADGAASSVRSNAGIAITTWSYPQSAFVTHVMPEHSHRKTAWQRFLPDGPLAFLPLQDGRVSVVWSTTPDKANSAMNAGKKDLADSLAEASDHLLGKLTVDGPCGSFPLKSQHAERYVLPGLALVGDAAHAVHPLAGQGANLGIADSAALVSAISVAIARGEYPGDLSALRTYERARKGANKTMLHFIDALNRLFLSDSETIASLRGSGMRLFNSSGPIQRRAVQVALGINM
jgi:2-octaprenylphenol hydroxylase